MYIPASFAEADATRLYDFIDTHSFATLVTTVSGQPFASHLPLLLDRERGVLLGHLARANPHWRELGDALVIFTGPHAYVSPAWYTVRPAVPTWNFTAVHVYGPARAVEEEVALGDIVDRLTRKYERDPAWLADLPADYRTKMLQAIVGVEVWIDRLEGKMKLSQNRSLADRHRVVEHLERDEDSRDLAALMRAALPPGGGMNVG